MNAINNSYAYSHYFEKHKNDTKLFFKIFERGTRLLTSSDLTGTFHKHSNEYIFIFKLRIVENVFNRPE